MNLKRYGKFLKRDVIASRGLNNPDFYCRILRLYTGS